MANEEIVRWERRIIYVIGAAFAIAATVVFFVFLWATAYNSGYDDSIAHAKRNEENTLSTYNQDIKIEDDGELFLDVIDRNYIKNNLLASTTLLEYSGVSISYIEDVGRVEITLYAHPYVIHRAEKTGGDEGKGQMVHSDLVLKIAEINAEYISHSLHDDSIHVDEIILNVAKEGSRDALISIRSAEGGLEIEDSYIEDEFLDDN